MTAVQRRRLSITISTESCERPKISETTELFAPTEDDVKTAYRSPATTPLLTATPQSLSLTPRSFAKLRDKEINFHWQAGGFNQLAAKHSSLPVSLTGWPNEPLSPTLRQLQQDNSKRPSLLQIKKYLEPIKTIRVMLESVCAEGQGHPAAVVNQMRSLRDLGFTGQFHVLYALGNSKALSNLLSGFDAGKKEIQNLSGNIVAQCWTRKMNIEWVPLTIASQCQIISCSSYNERYSTQVFFDFQPSKSAQLNKVYVAGKGSAEFEFNGIIYPLDRKVDEKNPLEMIQDKDTRWLCEYLVQKKTQHYFLTAYGLKNWNLKKGITAEVEIARLQKALIALKANKPIVVLCFEPVSKSLSAGDAQKKLDKAKAGEVFIVNIGTQPKIAYDFMVIQSNLPALQEGANTRLQCIAQGKPHIHGGRPQKLQWQAEKTDAKFTTERALFNKASQTLESPSADSEQDIEHVTDFFKQAMTGKLDAYFEAQQQEFLDQPLQMATALRVLQNLEPTLHR